MLSMAILAIVTASQQWPRKRSSAAEYVLVWAWEETIQNSPEGSCVIAMSNNSETMRKCEGGSITQHVQQFISAHCINRTDANGHEPYLKKVMKNLIREIESTGGV